MLIYLRSLFPNHCSLITPHSLLLTRQDPEAFFGHPQYRAAGNLFWPDAWHTFVKPSAYTMHGVSDGKGRSTVDQV